MTPPPRPKAGHQPRSGAPPARAPGVRKNYRRRNRAEHPETYASGHQATDGSQHDPLDTWLVSLPISAVLTCKPKPFPQADSEIRPLHQTPRRGTGDVCRRGANLRLFPRRLLLSGSYPAPRPEQRWVCRFLLTRNYLKIRGQSSPRIRSFARPRKQIGGSVRSRGRLDSKFASITILVSFPSRYPPSGRSETNAEGHSEHPRRGKCEPVEGRAESSRRSSS